MSPRTARRLVGCLSLLLLAARPAVGNDAPLLAFSVSPNNQPLSLTVSDAPFVFELTLDSLGQAVPDIELIAAPLTDSAGSRLPVRLSFPRAGADATKSIAALRSLAVKLEAELPRPGSYTTHLIPVYAGRRWPPLTLTVTRSTPELVVAQSLPAARATRWGSCASAVVRLALRARNGRHLDLRAATLGEPVYKRADGVRFAAPLVVLSQQIDGSEFAQPFGLEEGQTRDLMLRIGGFPEAGEYEVRLFLDPVVGTGVERLLSIYVREPLWAAALWIAVGVLLSWAVREYLVRQRPRLVLIARLEALVASLGEDLRRAAAGSEQASVIESVRDEAQMVRASLLEESAKLTEREVEVEILEKKLVVLREWTALLGRAQQHPPISALVQQSLDSVETALVKLGATAQDLATATAALATLRTLLPPPPIASAAGPAGRTVPARPIRRLAANTLRRRDLLVSLVVAAVAIVMGIKALWLGDFSWGGWEDRFVGFLWGLGLHQATFTGLEALRATLVR